MQLLSCSEQHGDIMKVSYHREMIDGAALMSPDTIYRISMAFCSSSFLYSDTILDSVWLSQIRIFRRNRLLNFRNLKLKVVFELNIDEVQD